MQAYLAILQYDAGQLARSWIARLWFPLLLAPALFLVVVAATENELASETMGAYVMAVLLPISAIAIAVLTTGAVSGELGVLSDGILSRSVTRSEYLWAKITARVGFTLGVYVLVMAPFAYLVMRYAAPDHSASGVLVGTLMVGMMLVFLSTLGIVFSTIFSNTLFSVLLLLVLIVLSGVTFQFFGLDWLSVTAIVAELPETFRGETPAWNLLRVIAALAVLSVLSVMIALWVFRRRDL